MKKVMVLVLVLALALGSGMTALADGGSQPPEMPSGEMAPPNGENGQPPEKPDGEPGEKPDGEMPGREGGPGGLSGGSLERDHHHRDG